MIYLDLVIAFLQVGLFSFGGAYGAIPLIRDIVLSKGWLSEEVFSYFIAVSESTPGPIMVNMATYIGSSQAGLLGALIATLGVVLPSFIIILLIVAMLSGFLNNNYVQAALRGIRPCFIGIVLAVGIYYCVTSIFPQMQFASFEWRNSIIMITLGLISLGYQSIKHKEISPIILIIVSAMMGTMIYAI